MPKNNTTQSRLSHKIRYAPKKFVEPGMQTSKPTLENSALKKGIYPAPGRKKDLFPKVKLEQSVSPASYRDKKVEKPASAKK